MDILDKIKRLLALAGSDNVHEAALAAKTAQKLMARHNIEAAMLEVDSESESQEQIGEEVFAGVSGKRLSTWKTALCATVARVNGCSAYSQWFAGDQRMVFVGTPSDSKTARYMSAWLIAEIDRLTKLERAKRGPQGRSYYNSFRLGAAHEIARRLKEAHRDAAEESREMARAADRVQGTSTQLVKVEAALVRVEDKLTRAQDFMKRKHPDMESRAASRARINGNAFAEGKRAGGSVSLTHGRAALSGGARGRVSQGGAS